MELNYMDDRIGFVSKNDLAYVMDCFGNAVLVCFCLPAWFWQDH